MAKNIDRLWSSFNKLTGPEQGALMLLAVGYEPMTQTRLTECLRQAGYESSLIGKQWREKMKRRHLIIFVGNRMTCAPGLDSRLAIKAFDEGDYQRLLSATSSSFGSYMSRHYHNERTELESNAFQRNLRDALIRGDKDNFTHFMRLNGPYAELTPERAKLMLELIRPVDPTWYARLPAALQYQLTAETLSTDHLVLNSPPDSDALIEATPTDHRSSAPFSLLLQERALFRGERVDTDGDDSARGLRVAAAAAFMAGDNELAIARYRKSLTARRRELGRRDVQVPGLHGLYYCFALVKLGGRKMSDFLSRQETDAAKHYLEPLKFSFSRLREFRSLWDGHTTEERLGLPGMRYNHQHPHNLLTAGVVRHWLGEALPQESIETFTKYRDGATDYPWFQREIAGLLAVTAGGSSPANARLIDWMPRLEPWERALQALAELSPGTSKTSEGETTDSVRLAWLVSRREDGLMDLQAREQKLRKNGAWTKGRPVALSRLVEGSEALDYLTRDDERICRTIERDPWGYYGRSYHLPVAAALAAADGHPAVFYADDPTSPLEIRRRQPELIVSDEGEYIGLSLHPSSMDADDDNEDDAMIHVGDGDIEYRVFERPGGIDVYQIGPAHHNVMSILGTGLRVPARAREQVVASIRAISPLLTVHSDLAGADEDVANEQVEPDGAIHINMRPQGDTLRADFGVHPFGSSGPRFGPGEGGATVFAEVDGQRMQATRDLAAERAAFEDVLEQCPGLYHQHGSTWTFASFDDALNGLLALREMEPAPILNWPEGEAIRLRTPRGPSPASLSVQSHQDWFEITGEVQVDDDEVIDMQRLFSLLSADNDRFVRLGDNEFMTLTDELSRQLRQLRAIGGRGRVHRLAGVHLDDLAAGMTISADEQFDNFRRRLADARDIDPTVPPTLEADLRDYQVEGYKWLARLAAWGAGACLADDMGLGKTLQALALIVSRAADGPALVLAPTSVCANWMDESARFAPTLNAKMFGADDRAEMCKDLGPFDLVICSYGLLVSADELLGTVDWHTIVADEAQAFKNANTARSKAVMKLRAPFRMVTTGTPIENHLGELWNLFNFINPGLLGSREVFNREFAKPISSGDEQARVSLRQLISPFVLRRLKRDVLRELPPRTEIVLTIEQGRDEAALYEALRREAQEQVLASDSENQQRMIALAQITRLRQMACHPALVVPDAEISSSKLAGFGEVIEELRENNHRALVFSQFVQHLSLVRTWLDDHDIPYQYLDGSMRPVARKKAVNAFQSGEGDVFLISLKAGGTGLNLTAANYVIHLDPWWNPAVEDQASDRAHRLGQQRPVTVYRLVTANTIEQKIVELHRRKRDLADSLLEGADGGARLTLDDMLALLSS